MVWLSRLSDPNALVLAIEEFNRVGREEFRRAYKGGKSRDYVAVVDGVIIDSKPLAACAYSHQFNTKITCRDFNGGAQTRQALKPLLELLGHSWKRISEVSTRPPSRDDDSQLAHTIHELLNARGAIETESQRVAESDTEILLFSSVSGDEDQLGAWEGWSQGGRVYNFPLAGREMLDVLLNHELEGRSLRLFERMIDVPNAQQTFLDAGTCQLDPEQRFAEFDAEATSALHIVRLRISASAESAHVQVAAAAQPIETEERADLVPLEQHSVSTYEVTATEARTANKTEQELVENLTKFLRSRQHTLQRFKISTHGSLCPLFTDLYDATDRMLYEAKSSVARYSLRLALGQILDYRRYLDTDIRTSILVPMEPQRDMLNLLDSYSVSTVWKGANNKFLMFSGNTYSEL